MTLRTLALPASLALAAGLLGGCGAGEAIFGPETVTLHGVATLDGYVTSAGDVLDNSATQAIAVGDNTADETRRGFVRFSLLGLPAGAEIQSAELRMAQASIAGAPYATLGTVRVDHVNIDLGLALGLDAGDYAETALLANIGQLSVDAVLTVKTLDVTVEVIADVLAGRTTSDYRLRFSALTDSDATSDAARFEDMENHQGTGQVPLLVIQYK